MDNLNKQNKRHFALFGLPEMMEFNDGAITWAEAYLYLNAGPMNRRLNKMSPRRGKTKFVEELEGNLEDLMALIDGGL